MFYYDHKHSQAEFQLGNLRNMRKLSRKGGKMDKEWTGTFTIAEVCGKGYIHERMHMERF